MGLDDKSDEGRSLRVSIKEYIEENDLDVAITRSKTNKDLLDEIENALNGADEDIKNDEDDTSLPAQMDEDDENDEKIDPMSDRCAAFIGCHSACVCTESRVNYSAVTSTATSPRASASAMNSVTLLFASMSAIASLMPGSRPLGSPFATATQ